MLLNNSNTETNEPLNAFKTGKAYKHYLFR